MWVVGWRSGGVCVCVCGGGGVLKEEESWREDWGSGGSRRGGCVCVCVGGGGGGAGGGELSYHDSIKPLPPTGLYRQAKICVRGQNNTS